MTTRDTHRQGEEISKAPSPMVDEEFQSFTVVATASPLAITFGALGLKDMADNAYRVVVGSEGNALSCDESTKAESGFSILGGTGAQVANVLVHGKIAGRRR